MITFAVIAALVIGGALCMLVGYAIGATRGERDGARRERLMAEAWSWITPPCPSCGAQMSQIFHGHWCPACGTTSTTPEERAP